NRGDEVASRHARRAACRLSPWRLLSGASRQNDRLRGVVGPAGTACPETELQPVVAVEVVFPVLEVDPMSAGPLSPRVVIVCGRRRVDPPTAGGLVLAAAISHPLGGQGQFGWPPKVPVESDHMLIHEPRLERVDDRG